MATSRMSTSILIIEADPRDAGKTRFGNELNLIKSRLKLLNSKFLIHSERAVSKRRLNEVLRSYPADIVHFLGHANEKGHLIFEDDDGYGAPVKSAKALSQLFGVYSKRLRCLVLNSCFSDVPAAAIASSISCVIGTPGKVSDEVATAFSGGFYLALAAGESVQRALEMGNMELALLDPAAKPPKLYERTAGAGKKLRFVPPKPREPKVFACFEDENDANNYGVVVRVDNLPAGVKQVVYEYADNVEDTISFKNKFDVVIEAKAGFTSDACFLGDVVIRAMIWIAEEQGKERGICLSTYLVQALRAHYGKKPGRKIELKIRDIEQG
jgi:hypothetical protein